MLNRRIATISIDHTDLSLIRRIESAKIINNADGVGFDPEGPSLPLDREEAKALLDSQGEASVVLEVDVEDFARALAADSSAGGDDIYDFLHEVAFDDLGVTTASSYTILGVGSASSTLIVRYTTLLYPFFAGDEEG